MDYYNLVIILCNFNLRVPRWWSGPMKKGPCLNEPPVCRTWPESRLERRSWHCRRPCCTMRASMEDRWVTSPFGEWSRTKHTGTKSLSRPSVYHSFTNSFIHSFSRHFNPTRFMDSHWLQTERITDQHNTQKHPCHYTIPPYPSISLLSHCISSAP